MDATALPRPTFRPRRPRQNRAAVDNRSGSSILASATLVAHGSVRVSRAEVPALRKQTAPPGTPAPPVALTKFADEQGIVALAAVLGAIHKAGLPRDGFADWGVVAAPKYLGLYTVADTYDRFVERGPMAVSPLIIPYQSLHSVASLLSLALNSHGPNVGAGADEMGLGEALLTGLTLLDSGRLPGMWVVATSYGIEDESDEIIGRAVALALTSWHGGGPMLSLDSEDGSTRGSDLKGLATWLAAADRERAWSCTLPGGLRLRLADMATADAA